MRTFCIIAYGDGKYKRRKSIQAGKRSTPAPFCGQKQEIDVFKKKLAFVSAINDVSVRMFNNIFVGSSPTEKKVLAAMHESGLPLKWGEMLKLAEGAGIKKTSARTAVKRLVDGGLLKQITEEEHEGCHIFKDKLFREYIGAKTMAVS
jgi:predicted transcriptional regulator